MSPYRSSSCRVTGSFSRGFPLYHASVAILNCSVSNRFKTFYCVPSATSRRCSCDSLMRYACHAILCSNKSLRGQSSRPFKKLKPMKNFATYFFGVQQPLSNQSAVGQTNKCSLVLPHRGSVDFLTEPHSTLRYKRPALKYLTNSAATVTERYSSIGVCIKKRSDVICHSLTSSSEYQPVITNWLSHINPFLCYIPLAPNSIILCISR